MIRIFTLSTNELALLSANEVLHDLRSNVVTFIWTPISSLKSHLLTVLSPVGSAFWSAAEYRSFSLGVDRVMRRLRAAALQEEAVCRIIDDSGGSPNSFYSDYLLRPITREFGDKFSAESEYEAALLCQRSLAVLVPNEDKESVLNYFCRQLSVLPDALAEVDESIVLANTGNPADNVLFELLSTNPLVAVASGVPARLRSLVENPKHLARCFAMEPWFGCRGGVHVAILNHMSDFTLLDELKALVELRIGVAIAHSSKLILEQVRHELIAYGWCHPAVCQTGENLISRIQAALTPFPILEMNPFSM